MLTQETLKKLRRIDLASRRLVQGRLAGGYRSAFRGQGMELEDLRVYQPGDPVRSIDWNVTARAGTPHVKTFREERQRTLILLVDVSASTRFGTGAESKLDVALQLTSLLALSAIHDRDRVGLLLFSDRIEHYVPPARGRSHVLRLLRDLLEVQPTGVGTDLGQALRYLDEVQRRGSFLVLISDLLCKVPSLELARVSSRHDLLALLPTDPGEAEPPNLGLLTLEDVETGQREVVDSASPHVRQALRAEWQRSREAALQACREAQVDALEVHVDRDWVEDLLGFLVGRSKRLGRQRARTRRAPRRAS